MSNKYHMLLFDFFNTLVHSDASRRPTMELDGKPVITTAHLLHKVLVAEYPGVEALQIFRAMEAARKRAQEQWGSDFREPPALEKFRYVTSVLGIHEEQERIPQMLLQRHMEAVIDSFVFPPAHFDLLTNLRQSYRLAIFSNFDHAPALLQLLRTEGINDFFEPVIISEQIGFRKPGRNAFRHALALAGEPVERILFIGDSLKDDVHGALGVNLDVAWLNLDGGEAPPDCSPTYELPDLLKLESLLENT
jgi:FMN phosphatase YigB (HAD superfamily)